MRRGVSNSAVHSCSFPLDNFRTLCARCHNNSSYATIVLCSLRNSLRKRGARASDNELSEM